MRKLLYIYASWCNPCKAVKNTVIKDIEEECPEQVEYIDMSIKPTYPEKYKIKVTTVPRLAFIDNDNTVKAVSALIQTLKESFIKLTKDRPEQTAKSGQYKLNEEHLSDDSRLLVNAFLVGMSMLEDAYPEYITVHI